MCMHWEGWWQSSLEDNPFGSTHPFIRSSTRWPTISHSQSGVLREIVFALQVIERALPIYCANWLNLRYSNCCQASTFLEPFLVITCCLYYYGYVISCCLLLWCICIRPLQCFTLLLCCCCLFVVQIDIRIRERGSVLYLGMATEILNLP